MATTDRPLPRHCTRRLVGTATALFVTTVAAAGLAASATATASTAAATPVALSAAKPAETAVGTAAGATSRRPASYLLPGPRAYPEGIAADGSSLYVTSALDGSVFRGDLRRAELEVWLPGGADGRTTALGLDLSPDGERLVVAGGASGRVFVHDTADGRLVAGYQVDAGGPSVVNDVAFAPDGDVYLTDSLRPVLYRLTAVQVARGGGRLEAHIDFTGTALRYGPGFNANGIAATPDGRYAVVVQSRTGKLYRLGLQDRSVVEIDLGGATVSNGDGVELRGRTLYVVRNAVRTVSTVRLSGDLASGVVTGQLRDASFRFPTTAVLARGRLLVVNSQFDVAAAGGTPEPFTVSAVRVP